MKIKITDMDVIMITYDEPNKEYNWSDLKSKYPKAKRVDNIQGFDKAHKAAATLSDTDRFIIIDGDNVIEKAFLYNELDLKPEYGNSVISWSSKNHINGLIYGNGSIKCWDKNTLLNIKSHENATEEKGAVDFCWDVNYINMNNVYATVYNNTTPYQSFRAGFREGVKMSLKDGLKISNNNFKNNIYTANYQRLLVWFSVGADVDNGLWAIYGSRLGCQMLNLTNWDYSEISDYEKMNKLWKEQIYKFFYDEKNYDENKLLKEIYRLGEELRIYLNIDLCLLDEKQSKWFKECYINPKRMPFNFTTEMMENYLNGK